MTDVYDMTQGPSASISAGPSAITRIYAAFCAKDVDPSMWAQTARRQVRMLDAFPYVSVLNGYAVLDDLAKQNTPTSIDDVTGLVSVGLQTNTQVTYGKRAEGYFRCTPSNIKVNQVFCAALNMKQGEAGAMSRAHKNAAFVSKALLRAAYHCTFLAAIANKSQKLFLTMLGCGAFGNEPTEVFEEIADSFKSIAEDPNVNRGGVLKKVYLVLYRKTAIINTFVETLKQKRINYKVFVNGIQVPL